MKFPTCLTFQNRQHSESIINHRIPNKAWTKIAVDPFRFYEHYYLLMIDYYSKFFVIETLKNLHSSAVVNKCKKMFSQFGTRKELVTDNGPEFTSDFFKLFSRTWDFEHRTTGPHDCNWTHTHNCVLDMTRTYIQMHRTDKYSQHSSII